MKGPPGPTSHPLLSDPVASGATRPSGVGAPGGPSNPVSVRPSLIMNQSKLSTTDLLVLASMKNAAKCDK